MRQFSNQSVSLCSDKKSSEVPSRINDNKTGEFSGKQTKRDRQPLNNWHSCDLFQAFN